MRKIDLNDVRTRWLNQCGSCDAGLHMNCTCVDEDPRNVILKLVDALEDLYNNYDMLLCSSMEDAVDRALHSERIAELTPGQMDRVESWMSNRSGSFSVGRVTFEAVEGGGILVRTRAYRGLDNTTS